MAQLDLEALSHRLNMHMDNLVGTNMFSATRYFIASSVPQKRQLEIAFLLDNNGATRAQGLNDEELNLIITNSLTFEGWQTVGGRAGVQLVTDLWVEKGLVSGKVQSAAHFSPDPSMIFSGVIACATSIPVSDYEVLQAGITALGGQWRSGLTKDVTHLFAISKDSQKYATAFNFKHQTGVKVLLPHWFDDAMRLGTGKLDTDVYEWPEPTLLSAGELDDSVLAANLKSQAMRVDPDNSTRMALLANAARFTPSNHNPQSSQSGILTDKNIKFIGAATPPLNVWDGKKILLSRTLQLWKGRREAVQMSIERAGGVVVRYEGDDDEEEMDASSSRAVHPDSGDPSANQIPMLVPEKLSSREKERRKNEAAAVRRCNVYVTRWRSGGAYVNAFNQGKIIGTMAWLFEVQSSGTMSNPPDQLLHYPIPQRVIEGMSNHVISVTNYTGEAREYLKKLITAMGAKFTPSMSGQNTALIAAYTTGTKASKALAWSIPVVNHTWLEDCFVQWRNLTVATQKYLAFPTAVDFAGMLGVRGVDMEGVKGEVEELERELEEEAEIEAEQRALALANGTEIKEEEDVIPVKDAFMPPRGEEEEEEEEDIPLPNTDSSMKEVQGLVAAHTHTPAHPDPNLDLDMDLNPDVDVDMDPPGTAAGMDIDIDWQFNEADLGRTSPVAQTKRKETARERQRTMDVEGPSVMEEVEMIDDEHDTESEDEEDQPAPAVKTPARPSASARATTKTPAKTPIHAPAATTPAKTPAKTPVKTPLKSRMKGKSPKKKNAQESPVPMLSSPLSEEENEVEEVEEEPVRRGDKGKERVKKKPAPPPSPSPEPEPEPEIEPEPTPQPDILELSDDDDEEEVDFRAMLKSAKDKGKQREKPASKRKAVLESSEEEEEQVEVRGRRKSSGKSATIPAVKDKAKPKVKAKAPTPPPTSPSHHSEEDEKEEEEEIRPTKKQRGQVGKAKEKQKEKEREKTRSPSPIPKKMPNKLTRRVTVEIITSPSKKTPSGKSAEKGKEKEKLAQKDRQSDTQAEYDEASDYDNDGSDEESGKKKKTPAKPSKPTKAATTKPTAVIAKSKGRGRGKAKSTDDEDDIVPAPKPRASASKSRAQQKDASPPPSTATAAAAAAAAGLLKKTTVDARTKIRKRKSEEKPKEVEVESEEEEEEEVVHKSRAGTKAAKEKNAKTKAAAGKKGKGRYVDSEDEDEDEEVEELVRPEKSSTKKSQPNGKGKKAPESSDEEEERRSSKKQQSSKKPLRVYSTEEEEASSDDEVHAKSSKTVKGKGNQKATTTSAISKSTKTPSNTKKVADVEPDDTESESEVEEPQPKPRGRASKATTAVSAKGKEKATKAAPKSKSRTRQATPDDTDDEEREDVVVSPRSARALARTQSIKAVAGEARAKSPSANISARGRKASTSKPSTSKATSSRAPPDPDAMDVDDPTPGTSGRVSPTPISTMSNAPPRRSAATKATQKLRDTIMPDVMNFENQRRKSRKSGTAAFVVIGDSLPREEEASAKRRRDEKEKEKEASNEQDEDGDEEDADAPKPRKKRRVSDENDDTNATKGKGKGKAKEEAKGKKDLKPSIKPGDVVVMTTQVTLPDETVKTLDKLGVKFTTIPEECTHLVASNFVRTEKFICALASSAPHILTKEWCIDSAAAGELQPVDNYGLKDPEGEKRYNVKLADALRRAKANKGGKLLNGATIFVTPKVSVKKELLQHVIQACGGVFKRPGDFTQRMLKGHTDRYLVSCPEDKAIWSRFSNQDIPVYTHELILNGALQQKMEWENADYRLDG